MLVGGDGSLLRERDNGVTNHLSAFLGSELEETLPHQPLTRLILMAAIVLVDKCKSPIRPKPANEGWNVFDDRAIANLTFAQGAL